MTVERADMGMASVGTFTLKNGNKEKCNFH